jgi:hypothetical protein
MYYQMPLSATAPTKGSITGNRTPEQAAADQAALKAMLDGQKRAELMKKVGIGLLVVAVLGGGAVLLIKK